MITKPALSNLEIFFFSPFTIYQNVLNLKLVKFQLPCIPAEIGERGFFSTITLYAFEGHRKKNNIQILFLYQISLKGLLILGNLTLRKYVRLNNKKENPQHINIFTVFIYPS